jgi:hypothetical protein
MSKRSSSASVTGKASVDVALPAIKSSKQLSLCTALAARKSAPRRFGHASLDMLKEAHASCQDIEMDAEIQANHMLKYQELKFKSCLPKLSEVLQDAQNRMPSKVSRKGYVFSGFKELKEAAQDKVREADLVDLSQFVSERKPDFNVMMADDGNASMSVFKDTQPVPKARTRSNSPRPQFELQDLDNPEANYLMFRKRFNVVREKACGDSMNWRKELRPDVVTHHRPPLPCDPGFHLHLANVGSTKSIAR